MTDSARTVILVRHADIDGDPASDPPLNAAGIARAQALRRALARTGIGEILVTPMRRTRLTAEPLAADLGLLPRTVPNAHLTAGIEGVITAIRDGPPSSIALVVGHSHTLPRIISALSNETISPIGASEFDRLFVLSGQRLIQLQYGA